MTLTLSVTRLSSLDTFWSADKRNVPSIPKRNLFEDSIAKSIKSASCLRMDTISSFSLWWRQSHFFLLYLVQSNSPSQPNLSHQIFENSQFSPLNKHPLYPQLSAALSLLSSVPNFSKDLSIFTLSIYIPSTYSTTYSGLGQCGFWMHCSTVTSVPQWPQIAKPNRPFSVCLAWLSSSMNAVVQPFFLKQWLSLPYMTQVVYQPPPWQLSHHLFTDHPCLHSQ